MYIVKDEFLAKSLAGGILLPSAMRLLWRTGKMGTVEYALLMKLVVSPLLTELAERRGVHGVQPSDLSALLANPKTALAVLDGDPELRGQVATELADGLEMLLGGAVDAVLSVLARVHGGADHAESDVKIEFVMCSDVKKGAVMCSCVECTELREQARTRHGRNNNKKSVDGGTDATNEPADR